MGEPEITDAVRAAIRKGFPNDYLAILSQLQWNGDHWWFRYAGMYVGVETDGYIHT